MAKPSTDIRRLSRKDLDALSEGLVWQDSEGRIIDANAAAAPILGLTQDELLGRTSHDPRWYAVHEDGTPWPGHDHPCMRALRTSAPQRQQLMGVMVPNAGRRWIRIDATPQFSAGADTPVGVMASFVDITAEVEQRHRLQQEIDSLRSGLTGAQAHSAPGRAQALGSKLGPGTDARSGSTSPSPQGAMSLAELQAHLDRVQAVARVGSFAMRSDPEQFTYTRETARLFDLDDHGRIDFAGWFSRVHPEDRPAVQSAWQAALRGADYDMTYRIVARDEVTWIRARAELQFDTEGRLRTAVGTVMDITDLKAIEFELERSRQHLQLALDASALGTWDFDLRTGRVDRDERFLAMLGYVPGELDSDYRSFTKLVHPDDLDGAEAAAAAHFRGETAVYEHEHRLRHKEGHFVWVLSVGKVVERDAEAKPLRIVGSNRDITDHKRLADGSIGLLRRIEKLIGDLGPGRQAAKARPQETRAVDALTKREREIAALIAAGLTSAQVAKRLQLATPTVITHRRNMMAKLKLRSTAQVTRFAMEQGLLDPD